MENENNNHWHLEKKVSVGHIITTLTVAGSVLIWAVHMETRVSLLESGFSYSKETDARLEKAWHDDLNKLEAMLIRIEMKLDSKQDKREGR